MALLVFLRVLLSVSANTIQKRLLLEGVRVIPVWLVTYLLMAVVAVVVLLVRPAQVSEEFWYNVALGGVLDAAGNLFMVAALRSTDLSIFGPLNAFRPVLALLFGWFFLGEVPTGMGALGIGVIVLGALVLFGRTEVKPETSRQEVLKILAFRLAGLSLSAIGAVYLKRAAMLGSAELTLSGWILCGLICLWGFSLVRRERPLNLAWNGLRTQKRWLLIHTTAFFVMQWFTILIFQQTLLAYSFAYFQLGMVLQVIVGAVVFKEPALGRRLFGCVIMCVGSGLVVWKG